MDSQTTEPLVSVVITTRNEENNIGNCLLSVKSQTYKNIEIIVIDNNSTDQTKQIANIYTNKISNVGPERAQQRNYGILRIAKGEYMGGTEEGTYRENIGGGEDCKWRRMWSEGIIFSKVSVQWLFRPMTFQAKTKSQCDFSGRKKTVQI